MGAPGTAPVTISAVKATETIGALTRPGIQVAVVAICGDGLPEDPATTATYRQRARAISNDLKGSGRKRS